MRLSFLPGTLEAQRRRRRLSSWEEVEGQHSVLGGQPCHWEGGPGLQLGGSGIGEKERKME